VSENRERISASAELTILGFQELLKAMRRIWLSGTRTSRSTGAVRFVGTADLCVLDVLFLLIIKSPMLTKDRDFVASMKEVTTAYVDDCHGSTADSLFDIGHSIQVFRAIRVPLAALGSSGKPRLLPVSMLHRTEVRRHQPVPLRRPPFSTNFDCMHLLTPLQYVRGSITRACSPSSRRRRRRCGSGGRAWVRSIASSTK
jgi:hypothetical protein